jgi:hypothetical protein
MYIDCFNFNILFLLFVVICVGEEFMIRMQQQSAAAQQQANAQQQ